MPEIIADSPKVANFPIELRLMVQYINAIERARNRVNFPKLSQVPYILILGWAPGLNNATISRLIMYTQSNTLYGLRRLIKEGKARRNDKKRYYLDGMGQVMFEVLRRELHSTMTDTFNELMRRVRIQLAKENQ